MHALEALEHKITRRMRHGNLRALDPGKKSLCDFASNDYLGMARSGVLAHLCLQEWEENKTEERRLGSTGSRLLTGNSTYAESLEAAIASFHGFEAGLLFNCGYMANVGLLSAIPEEGDTVLFDTNVHASIHDGIRLSRAQAFPFRHNDLDHLEHRLKAAAGRSRVLYLCVESLYSTDGSKAPLQELCRLSNQYGAALIVDEAHAVGVFGSQGRGLVQEQGVVPQIFAQVVTFGKAIGTSGAIVLGSRALRQGLINFARSFIYTTAMPFYQLAAIRCSYQRFPQLEEERTQLKKLIQLFQALHAPSSASQIQSVECCGNEAVRKLAEMFAAEGVDARPLMSPTVRQGHERVRLCLHAFNTEKELVALLQMLESYRSHHA